MKNNEFEIVVVGSGIVGLSVAEYFSRTTRVLLISNENPLSASPAAAANLATKGQLFARDLHFKWKLDGKKKYLFWLQNLLKEVEDTTPIDDIYKNGIGLDIFSTQEERDHHLRRVLRSDGELNKHQLNQPFIQALDDLKIEYQDEAWVHAEFLLNLLRRVLKKRGVEFHKKNFDKNDLEQIVQKKQILIFCTGAWTLPLLQELKLSVPNSMLQKERLSFGTTLYFSQNPLNYGINKYILVDKYQLKSRVTLSGGFKNNFYLSSTTIKFKRSYFIDKYYKNNDLKLSQEEKNLILLTSTYSNDLKLLVEQIEMKKKCGYRVGYGHYELILDEIKTDKKNIFIIVGVHKSGFLYAPILGELFEKKYTSIFI